MTSPSEIWSKTVDLAGLRGRLMEKEVKGKVRMTLGKDGREGKPGGGAGLEADDGE